MRVEFIYDHDCPNVTRTRENLLRAFAQADVPAKWTEWERSSLETPDCARQFGSPTILVKGRDVAGQCPNAGAACRIYRGVEVALSGVPSIELISEALKRAGREVGATHSRGFKRHLVLVPAILMALLPKVACPACWPAYMGLLSVLGLGFLARTEHLLPLTGAFLTIVLASLAHRAKTRRGYGPLLAGVIAAGLVLLGKFLSESNVLFYSGLIVLVGSSIWNTWPRSRSKTASCCEGTPRRTQVTPRVQEN